MALEQRLNLKLSQRLVMTQSLQQAIRLLQMSRLELQDEIQNELLENPVLEENEYDNDPPGERESAGEEEPAHDPFEKIDIDAYFQDYLGDYQPNYQPGTYDFSDQPPFENLVTKPESLHDHLERQLGLAPLSPAGYEIGIAIIGNINEDGYLSCSLEDICTLTEASLEEVTAVWQMIREFDPRGVAARNLRECLEIQIAFSEWCGSDVETMLLDHFDLIAKQKYRELMAVLNIDKDQLKDYLKVIQTFEPKPGRAFAPMPPQYVQPDVYIVKVDGEYVIQLNDEGMPRLQVSHGYQRMMEQLKGQDKEGANYIKEKFKNAMWLIKSLDQRNRTIYKVAESLVRHQRDFFEHGLEHMRPLVLREIAEDIGMHESTVSRVVNNKFVHTPRGVFELKFFFRSGITSSMGEDVSSLAVKEKIRKLAAEESPSHPYSDAALVKILTREGIHIARRTVAKYREELGIPSSSKRKRKL
ncbi:MAG: RNA polymerase factor sigma-54 [Acidobacteria bacterium]|nr:RNA polymerase factor sigma-54 [Acidobacteriota bacterium]MCB9396823.1 RNA polymerase factor sigma-54 [Acidobacteriota bacterium]